MHTRRRAQARPGGPATSGWSSGCGAQLAAAPAPDGALEEPDDELADEPDDEVDEELDDESDELALPLEAGTLAEEPERLSVR